MPGHRKEGEPEHLEIPQSPPEIVAVDNFSEVERLLRQVKLKDEVIPGFYPYFPSSITLEEVSLNQLHPCAMYVLRPKLEWLKRLREAFLPQGIDILNLPEDKTRITFNWGQQKRVIISPPLVEVSEDDGGLWIITDGLHRRVLAKELGKSSITSIVIRNTAAPLPFLPVRWDEVKRVNRVPPTSEKRKPRFKSPVELKNWPKTSQRNYERFMDGFADPFMKLSMMHTYRPEKITPSRRR